MKKLFNKNDNAIMKYLKEKNLSHFFFKYDLLEYNLTDIYQSFSLSYFTTETNAAEHIFDSDELKFYESIESEDSVLIRKYKLRCSVKENDISNEIIISDSYDFDLSILSHQSSLIKIAFITDDVSQWIDSGNLANYDYVFIVDEDNKELLKDYSPTLIKRSSSIYLQLKNILNSLYIRRREKFYYFINQKFHYVFPKMNNYFRVLQSEFYDEDWYRQKYDIEDNTDPVIHYLLVGYTKEYDPGPDFSTFEYYECNPDIRKKAINPLVHYEQYGRKENRLVNFEDKLKIDYSLIVDSPYFDKDWYVNTYGLTEDDDPVDHYLRVGFKKGYNPGPDFSTFEYWECNSDIKDIKQNPLVHYELDGRNENRRLRFDDATEEGFLSLISNSSLFDSEWYRNTYDIPDDVDCAKHYLEIGYAIEYNPGPDFSTYEYYQCNKDVELYGMNPLLHYERYGKEEGRPMWIEYKLERDYSFIADSPLFDYEWYKNTYDMPDDVDCVKHYLEIGYDKGYNPGPDFSTYEYWECNNDAKTIKENPLVHYEFNGRKENRRIHLSNKLKHKYYTAISNSLYFDEDWYRSTYDIAEDIDCVNHYLEIGFAKGYNPDYKFNSFEYWECNPDVKNYSINPLLHYELTGKHEGRRIHLPRKRKL